MESGVIRQSSQLVSDQQIDYLGPLPPSEGSVYDQVCVDTASGLTQPGCHY